MRFYPSSYGTSRSATVRRTREYNGCHDSKSGEFSAKGQGDCGPGEWTDPGRNRAIYGQLVPDEEALALSRKEVEQAQEFLPDPSEDRVSAKKSIAAELGPGLEEHEGFNAFYAAHRSQINQTMGEFDGGNYGNTDGEYDWHDDPMDLKGAYDSDYESYKESAIEEQDEEYYQQQRTEFDDDHDRAKGAIRDSVEHVRELWNEVQAEREADPYGDLTGQPNLPGLEDVHVHSGRELDLIPYLTETLTNTEPNRPDYEHYNGREWDSDQGEIDWKDQGFRDEIKAELRGYTHVPAFEMTDEKIAQRFLDEHSAYFGGEGGKHIESYDSDGFDKWRENEGGGEPDYDIKSFESWYEDEHGKPEVENEDSGDDGGYSGTRGEQVAAYLVHQWAITSGDAHTVSVALQEAANREFKLGPTYAGVFTRRDADMGQVESTLKNHGPFLQHFLRTMYNNTQEKLKDAGIDHVTVYRGFNLGNTRSKERGLETVRKEGEFVDVLMQPMSSFSSDFQMAKSFSGYDRDSVIMGMRVPRSAVIGTTRTGFGALPESEYVLLGGRRPAFVTWPNYQPDPGSFKHPKNRDYQSSDSVQGFWANFQRADRRRKSALTSGGVVVGPGDAL